MTTYTHQRSFPTMSLDDAIDKISVALKGQGFGVLTRIDIKATLKEKLDVDFRPYTILGACNPIFAHRALTLDPQMGSLLPCNAVVSEAPEGGGVVVYLVSAKRVFAAAGDESVLPIAEEIDARLARALEEMA